MDYPKDSQRRKVRVGPSNSYRSHEGLLDVLEDLFPARFSPFDGATDGADAAIILENDPELYRQLAEAPFPAYVVDHSNAAQSFSPQQTRFGGRPSGQPWLHGRTIPWKGSAAVCAVTVAQGDEIIATADEQPVWVTRRNARGNKVILSGPFPAWDAEAPFILQLIRGALPAYLPLLDFLREITAPVDYDPAPNRACFMFDDPNLHSTTWGHLNYRQLIREAQEHDYHAAIATVPIDSWYTNPAAASLFRNHPDRVSLLMHGVKHTHAELHHPARDEDRAHELTLGLRWIERLERRHGVRVSRVMAPPHHACSPKTCELMLQHGYEAACVSWGALVKWNPGHPWPLSFGLGMTEFLGGLPVIPRFNFADHDDARVLLAAFLRQPIVMIGHHGDVAGSLEILAEAASKIRTLPEVQWGDMQTIARGCFLTKRTGNSLWIRLQARLVVAQIPEGVEHLFVDRPWLTEEASEPLVLQQPDSSHFKVAGNRVIGPIPARPGPLTLHCPPAETLSVPLNGSRLLPPVWPLARRLLCEARDRLAPFTARRKSP
jgi:hypothetical protein